MKPNHFYGLRLSNLEYLDAVQNNQKIEKQSNYEIDILELESGEHVIWQFEKIDRAEQQQYSQQKEWTILNSLLDNLLMKSRYKALDVKGRKIWKVSCHKPWYLLHK